MWDMALFWPVLILMLSLQIYKLMKQDSYARFLRSELYKECVVAEVEGKPLAHPGETDADDWNNEDTDLLKVDKGNKVSLLSNLSALSMKWYQVKGKSSN